MRFLEPEAKEGKGETNAVAGGDELLGEEDDADLAEKIERPGDRPRDEQGRQDTLGYPFQIPASLKYWMAPGW